MSTNEVLKRHLTGWMQLSTWDTLHPLDQQRFHRSLAACFEELGPSIDFDQFEQAMLDLLAQLHPTSQPVDRSERVRFWAERAEAIGSYLFDNGRRA